MGMKKCAFLTMDSFENFVNDDELLRQPLAGVGWEVEWVSWRREHVNWSQFDAVVIRSTWDYQHDPDAFLEVLQDIEAAGVRLFNDRVMVHWNMHKSYLKDLSQRGVGIIPTIWGSNLTPIRIRQLYNELLTDTIIIKPTIGANAGDTVYVQFGQRPHVLESIAAMFAEREYMVQPFMWNVTAEGEYSLFFFGGQYSHTVLKTTQGQDFRVQESFGGQKHSVVPDPKLLLRARSVMMTLDTVPLYARVDMVRDDDDDFLLMELELIEPSFFLSMDAGAPARFAEAFAAVTHPDANKDEFFSVDW